MDRPTVEVYEREAAGYAERRGVQRPQRATAFAEAHPLPSGSRVLAQHLERMAVNVAAAQRLRSG